MQTLKINDFIRNYKEKRLYNRTLLVRVCKVFQLASCWQSKNAYVCITIKNLKLNSFKLLIFY